MTNELRDITGFRGEKIVELCLTDYREFDSPLFRPGFLGDKWPAIDFYVELTSVPGKRPYLFAQVKSTSVPLTSRATNLRISSRKGDIAHLLEIPGPTYLFGVHEPSRRVFVRSVHSGTPLKAIRQISLRHELTSVNLRILHDEVRQYWSNGDHKSLTSAFL